MAHYLLVLALTFVASSLAIPFGGLGAGFVGPIAGPVIGIGHGKKGGRGGGGYSMPLKLTCAVNFTGPHGANGGYGLVNAIAVTIEERSGGGKGGFGGGHPSLFGGFVGGFGGLHGQSGLSATIDIFSAYGGPVSVAFTEKARPERGCYAEDFGNFFTGQRKGGLHHGGALGGLLGGGIGAVGLGGIGGYGGYGAGAYGGLDAYGYGAGLGGLAGGYGAGLAYGVDPLLLGGGFGFGIGHGPKHGSGSGGYGEETVEGVIAEVNLGAGAVSEINIDNLSGFKSLSELAGRGVVVCPADAVESDYGGGRCEGGIIACCALHYDMGDQSLNLGGGPGYGHPPPPPPPPGPRRYPEP